MAADNPEAEPSFPLTLEEMWGSLPAELKKTPASSEIGRLAQLLKAAGVTGPTVVTTPDPPLPGSDAALAEELGEDG